jgi:glycerol-3-phosphate dehydrogenase subunit B
MKYDVVIIGGGMSGLMSSIYLSSKGYNIALVSKGDPNCSISSGCIDLLSSDNNPLSETEKLPSEHPYQIAGKENVAESFAYFQKIMNDAGLPYVGDITKNRTILSPLAIPRQTALVPPGMEAADNIQTPLHIISFQGMKDFYPEYFISKYEGSECSTYTTCISSTTIGIATQFDDPEFAGTFLQWLGEQNIRNRVIAIPAVLGTQNPGELLDKMAAATGKPVFEIPTIPPSIPGLRLFNALKKYARQKDVDLYWGNAITEYTSANNTIQSVTIKHPGRPTVIEGKSFLLATGSFVSGGLFAQKTGMTEMVFDVPVSFPKNTPLLNANFFHADHPLGKSGITINADYQPVDSDFTNLYVAGSILANSQIMKYRCGHGMAIASGIGAAKTCARALEQ